MKNRYSIIQMVESDVSFFSKAVCYRLNIHIGDRLAVDSHKRKFLVSKVPEPEVIYCLTILRQHVFYGYEC